MRNLGLFVALWLAALLPTSSLALGLGEIQVNSFLNQPLDAEIEVISARPGEIDDLLVSLASSEAFARAGLARPRHLSDLRFSVRKNEEGDQAVIVVTTKAGVKEPFLNFLIEADWSKGRVLREFTILLDPPFYADQPAPVESVAEPVEQATSDEATASEIEATVSEIVEQAGLTSQADTSEPAEPVAGVMEPIALSEDTSQPAIPEPEPEPVSGGYVDETTNVTQGDVLVVKGDTLWSIASRYKDDDHTMSQVMLAFQRANPDAFNDGNINNMKAGAILRIPGAEELDALSQQESYSEVLVQNGLWDEYVARVTGVTAAVASEDTASEVEDTASTTVVQEDTAEAATGELSLLMPEDGESESTGTGDAADVDALRTKLALAEEELEASRIENQELESRITELQARLSKLEELQKMVEIEDDSLAQLQDDQAQPAPEAEEAVIDEAVTDDVVSETIAADEEALLEELLAEEAAAQAEEQAALQPSDAIEDVTDETVSEDTMADDQVAEAGTDEMVDDEVKEEPVVTPPAPVVAPEPATTRAPSIFDGLLPPEVIDMIPSMDSITRNPIILAALGGVILLLIILYFLRKRKGSADEETSIVAGDDDDLFAGDDEDELTPIHLVDGSEPDETDVHPPAAEDFVPAEPAEEPVAEIEEPVAAEPQDDPGIAAESADTEMLEPEAPAAAATAEQDDVLNEVDVYLAYGLYDNAEELLNTSLGENPERADYRSKLLDTYFATKNTDAFVKEAENLRSMGDAAKSYWDRVQVMGYELAPDNPLFSDAKDSGLSAADLEISKPQEADFDLGSADDTTNFSTTDFNLGDEDTGGDFSDSGSAGEAGQIAATQVLEQVGELPELGDEDDTNLRGEAEPESDELELPDDIGDELEFSIDEAEADSGAEAEQPAATAEADLDDISMDFDVEEDSVAEVEDNSEIDFETEFDAGLDEGDAPELDQAAADSGELELDTSEEGEEGYTETAIITPNYEDTEVVPDLRNSAAADEDGLDLGTNDTAIIDLDETSLETAELNLDTGEVSLETAELNLDTGELELGDGAEEDDDDEDISIIDFGGEDFVEPTDIVESVADGDEDDSDDVTGTFAPGDFEEPTAAVDSVSDIDDISDLMLPEDVDEVSTKLDLARAFIDMGDTEGARGSLEEVIAEGNADQKTEAQSLLEQI